MRVLIAGATGVLGRQLVPALRAAGHDVVALSRSGATVPTDGVEPVAVNAMDAHALRRVVRIARPDAVVNLLTAIPREIDPRHMVRDFARTNLLRTVATDHLLAAADEAGVGRVVSEGLAYAYAPSDAGPTTEDAVLWVDAPRQFRPNVDALLALEHRTAASHGVVLRFGHVYGPGTTYATDGSFVRQVRARRVPLVGGGTSVFSFVHVIDAAAAIVAAVESEVTGAVNVVDDDPAPMSEWLPYLAGLVGAPAPRSVPTFAARLAAGRWGAAYLTRLRGADNARARRDLGGRRGGRAGWPAWPPSSRGSTRSRPRTG